MKIRILFVAALLVAGCGPKPDANGLFPDGTLAEGHSALQGHVENAQSEPIAGAHVKVTDGSSTWQSDADEDGTYTLFLKPGTYFVTITKDGYDTDTFETELHSKLWRNPTSTLLAPADEEAKKNKGILDSLNLGDVAERCGEPQNGNAASLVPYSMYSYGLGFAVGQYGVDRKEFDHASIRATDTFQDFELRNIEFVTIWFGVGGQPITKAEVNTYDSNHSKTIENYTALPKLMPCLLKGGVAR